MVITIVSLPTFASWGGSEELWAAMALAALKDGHEVNISPRRDVNGRSSKIRLLEAAGANIVEETRSGAERPSSSHYERLFRSRPDVILLNASAEQYRGLFPRLLLDELGRIGCRYLVSYHLAPDTSFLEEQDRREAVMLFTRAQQIICPSQRTLSTLERHLARSLPQGLVLHSPPNLTDRTIVSWPSDSRMNLGSVARLDPGQKGQDILFEVLHSTYWLSQAWHLNLFGSGRHRAYLANLARHYGIEKRVTFHGTVSDVRAVWLQNHLLVLPSRFEGMPIALIEAMLCGRPAVVTDVGDNSRWVDDGITGFIAQAPTARLLDEALQRAWRAKERWQAIGVRAHSSASSMCDHDPGKTLLRIVLSGSGEA